MNTTGKLYGTQMINGKPVISLQVDSDAGLTELLEGDLLRIKVEKYKAHRSLNANSYMWVLIDEISKKTQAPRSEIYRQAIQEAGVMKPLVVKDEIAQSVTNMLTDIKPTGTGDFALTGASKKGWTEIYFYIGSSKYNTEEMSRLIDYVVEECKPLGIDTMTPSEIERLKEQWQNQ